MTTGQIACYRTGQIINSRHVHCSVLHRQCDNNTMYYSLMKDFL